MSPTDEWNDGDAFNDGEAIDQAMRNGWYRAVRRHRRLDIPLLVSRDGRITEIDPHEVEIPDSQDPTPDRETYDRADF